MGFVANSIRFPECKNFENRLRRDKVTESLKVETFLRRSVEIDAFKQLAQNCY